MKQRILLLSMTLTCYALHAATDVNRAKAIAELSGENSIFFLEHADDFMWDYLEKLPEKYGLRKDELSSVLGDVALQTIGQTNTLANYVRRGAVEALGRYGTRAQLPILEKVALRNDIHAAPSACRVYSEIATQDEYLALVGRIFDGEGGWDKRGKAIVNNKLWRVLKHGGDEKKPKIMDFLRLRVAAETNAVNMVSFDCLLSEFDASYAGSRERMLNIGRAIKSDKSVDARTLALLVKALESTRDQILEKEGRPAAEDKR